MVTLLPPGNGGRLGRMSETVFWSLETAAAHAEDTAAVEENVRLEDRTPLASMRIKHRGHIEVGANGDCNANEGTSRRLRALRLKGGIGRDSKQFNASSSRSRLF